MKRYLPLIVYPVVPALAGILMGTQPLALGVVLIAGAGAVAWKARRRPVLDILVPSLPAAGFPRPVAALVVTGLLLQAVASFVLGLGVVAGWSIAWLLPYAILPSSLLAAAVFLRRPQSR